MSDEKPRIIIDMVSDPVCPWCYVGKRALDRVQMALSFSHEVIVRYRPYQLAADTPQKGVNRPEYLLKKFPDPNHRAEMAEALRSAAVVAGLDFDPALPTLLPNSLNALRLLRWSHYEGDHSEMAEALFHAYWKEGADISSPEILSQIADKLGLDAKSIKARLETDEEVKDIKQEADAFRVGGVSGVPTYIINETVGFAGALPPDQLLETIKTILAEANE